MFSKEVIKFDSAEKIKNWSTVNDKVMGGVSTSKFYYDGNQAIFEGKISLKNNGGFASVRSDIKKISVSPKKKSTCFYKYMVKYTKLKSKEINLIISHTVKTLKPMVKLKLSA